MDSADRISHSMPIQDSSALAGAGTPKPEIGLKGQSASTTEHTQEQFKASFNTPSNMRSLVQAMVKNMPAPMRAAVGLAQSLVKMGAAVKKAASDLRSGASTFAKVSKSVIKGESPPMDGKTKPMDRAGAKAGLVAGKAILHTGRFVKGAAVSVKEKVGGVNLSETFKPLREGLQSLVKSNGEVRADKFKYVAAFRENFKIEEKVDAFVARTMEGASQKEINSVKKHLYKQIDNEIKAELRAQVKEIKEKKGEKYSDSLLGKLIKNEQVVSRLADRMEPNIQGKISDRAMASSLARDGKTEAMREHYQSEVKQNIEDSLESAQLRLQACLAKVQEEISSSANTPLKVCEVASALKKEEQAVLASLHPDTASSDKQHIMDEFRNMRGDLAQHAAVVLTVHTSGIVQDIKKLEAKISSSGKEHMQEVKALGLDCGSAVRIPSTLYQLGIILDIGKYPKMAENMERIRQFTKDYDIPWF